MPLDSSGSEAVDGIEKLAHETRTAELTVGEDLHAESLLVFQGGQDVFVFDFREINFRRVFEGGPQFLGSQKAAHVVSTVFESHREERLGYRRDVYHLRFHVVFQSECGVLSTEPGLLCTPKGYRRIRDTMLIDR